MLGFTWKHWDTLFLWYFKMCSVYAIVCSDQFDNYSYSLSFVKYFYEKNPEISYIIDVCFTISNVSFMF